MINIFIPASNDMVITNHIIDGKRVYRINDSVVSWLNVNTNGYIITRNINDNEEGCNFRFFNREDEVAFLKECVLVDD